MNMQQPIDKTNATVAAHKLKHRRRKPDATELFDPCPCDKCDNFDICHDHKLSCQRYLSYYNRGKDYDATLANVPSVQFYYLVFTEEYLELQKMISDLYEGKL
jgi:hypothetical protein